MKPAFTVDWLAIYTEEQADWCNAHQLEQALSEFFELHYAPELDSFGTDVGQTARFVAPVIDHGVAN